MVKWVSKPCDIAIKVLTHLTFRKCQTVCKCAWAIHIVYVWSLKYRQLEYVGGERKSYSCVAAGASQTDDHRGKTSWQKYDQSRRFYFGVIGNTCFLFSSAQWTKNKIGRIPNRGKLIMLKSNANKKMFVEFLTKKFSSIKNAIIC